MKRFSLRLWPKRGDHEPLDDEMGVVDAVVEGERKHFGVRSYLKQFYSPTIEEVDNPAAWYLLPPPPAQRFSVYVCRCITLVGLLLLLAGAGLIVFAYTFHPNTNIEDTLLRISIDQDEEGNFYIPPDRFKDLLQDPLHEWKVAGFVVFAVGAGLLAFSLIVPTCGHVFGSSKRLPFVSEDNTPNEPPQIYPATATRFKITPAKLVGTHRISPTAGPVPVMEEIARVQPGKRSAGGSPNAELEHLLQ
ncbi:hypothetical protein M3Y99_01086600 [Aphelenchoides fujianensis]|nr:hypothetical protein M3Y99_01246000 [Aphelenchoides fujianensis]KAI6230196.1 hypothetical protein M3Y99_01086600 [Aphelenchoides fujianensis]